MANPESVQHGDTGSWRFTAERIGEGVPVEVTVFPRGNAYRLTGTNDGGEFGAIIKGTDRYAAGATLGALGLTADPDVLTHLVRHPSETGRLNSADVDSDNGLDFTEMD